MTRILGKVAALPFEALGSLFAGSVAPPAYADHVEVASDEAAADIYAWAVASAANGLQPASGFEPVIAGFIGGLDYREAVLLADAGEDRIAAHMRGDPISGVPLIGQDASAWRETRAREQYRALQRCGLWQDLTSAPEVRTQTQPRNGRTAARIAEPDVEPAFVELVPGI
jgi:hypothetical protein